MAKANNPTTTFKVDVSELKAGIQEANRQIKLINSEFKAVSSSMDDWEKSTDGLTAKIKQLSEVEEQEKKKLEILKEQYKLVTQEQGENSKGAQDLAVKINNQTATVNKVAKSLDGYKEKLEVVERAQKEAEKTGRDFEDVLDEIQNGANESGDGFTVLKGTLADLASSAIQAVVSGLVDMGRELMALPEATKEFRTVFNATMESARDSVIGLEGATKAYEEFYRVSADEGQSAEATSHIASLVGSQGDLESALDGVVGAWVRWGDSISVEGLAEASNETARTGVVTGQFADSLNWAGESEDQFNEKLAKCTSEQERQKLVVDTLNRLYGENARAYEENNKSLLDANSANLNLLQSQSELATSIEPLTALWTNMKAKALDAITPAIEWLSEKIQDLNKYLSEHEGVATLLQAVVMGLAGAFTILAGALAIQAIIAGVTKAIALLNGVLAINPIVLIVAGITALVLAFVTLWKKSDAFREFWINLWKKIKGVAKETWTAISGFFSEAWVVIQKIWNGAKAFFSGIWDGIKAVFSGVVWYYKTIFTGAFNAIKAVFSGVTSFFSGVWNTIKSIFSNVGTVIGGAITKTVSSAVNKVLSTAVKIINGFISAINIAIGVINEIPGVKIKKLSKLSVPKLATGGVVDKATLAMIGENGKEAVVPLENNLGWIKGVASNISKELKTSGSGGIGGMGGGVTNNYNFNQTNNSPKALSRLEIYRQTKNQMLQLKGVNA